MTGRTYYYQVVATNDTTSSQPSDPVQVTDTPGDIVAVDDTPDSGVIYSVAHGKTLTISAAALLANDIDPNTDPTLSIQSFTGPGHGTLVDNHDGTFTYTAAATYAGDDSFTYTPTDQYDASSNAATVQIQVTDNMPEASSGEIGPVTQAQDANGNSLNYPAPMKGTLSAFDPDGDPLTFSASIVSGQGTFALTDASTGAYTFTPSQTDGSEVVVEFTATDGILTSNKAAEIFPGWKFNNTDPDDLGSGDNDGDEIIAGDSVPTAANEHFQLDENATLTVPAPGLLSAAADTDPASDGTDPGQDLEVNLDLIESPRNGTVAVSADGSFSYTPNTGFTGRDWLTWQVMDGNTFGYYATAFFDVQPVPQAAVTLTVGDATDPARGVPQDTPFVAVDDGYQSDDQPLADDDPSTVPPVGDPELVPASVNLSVPDGQSATWSLTFGAALRVFMPDPNTGKLNEVKSGDQFTYNPSNAHYALQVQGVADGAAVPITAMLMPGGSGQPAQANVKVNVGKVLQVLSVKDNAPGPVLTPAQLKAGVYLPLSLRNKDGVGNIEYQLPIVIHGLQGTATLRVPPNWVVLDAAGKPQPAADGLPLKPNADGSDIKLFVEATEPRTTPIFLTDTSHPGAPLAGLGSFNAKTFRLSRSNDILANGHIRESLTNGAGPVDVPQFGSYEYNVKNVTGGKWLSATGDAKITPNPNNASDETITWDAGANLGKAVYQANPQYIWDMPVNIYKIEVAQPVNGLAGPVKGGLDPDNARNVKVYATGTFATASVTVTGPAGSSGANRITAGFVQNLTVTGLVATYQNAGNATVIQASTRQRLDAHGAYWDTQDGSPTKLYPKKKVFTFNNTKYDTQFTPTSNPAAQTQTIATDDAPFIKLPVTFAVETKGGGPIKSLSLLWNLTLYIVGTTSESPSVYARQASTPWTFNGDGTFDPQYAFTKTGAAVQFTTNQWQPATANSLSPVVAPPRFNDIAEKDHDLKPV